jgi:DNA-binding CsgD family transcriptional regulator
VVFTVLLCVIAVGGMVGLWMDWPTSPGVAHVVLDTTVLAVSLGGIAYLWAGWMRARRSLSRTVEESHRVEMERDGWQQRAEKLLLGLGQEIDVQLQRWELTPAEREMALLLLKGYSHKEIAARLHRSERTARQHAVAVYRKSNLSGRAELAAFFLEGLLLPSGPEDFTDRQPDSGSTPSTSSGQSSGRRTP